MRLKTNRRYVFPVGPSEFWARISNVAEYPDWWPWLRAFEGERLGAGDTWRCTVRPPVPYVVRFTVTIDDVVVERSVRATVRGDITGTAELVVDADPAGCRTTLVADLAPDKQSLRLLSVAAPPVVRFGHNWVLDVGARQFISSLRSIT